MKWSLALLSLASFASGELVNVTLTLIEATADLNTLDLEVQVPVAGNDNDSSVISGSVNVSLDIDPETGTITTLEILSGDLSGTDVSLASGNFLASYDMESNQLGGTLLTLGGPSAVVDGQSAAEQHEFSINSGTLTGTALVFGNPPTSISEDFASTPATGAGTVGTFVKIESTPNTSLSTATMAVYDLEFIYPVNITQEVDVGVTISFLAEGTFQATGQVSLAVTPPNPYLAWAEANGIANAPFEGKDFDDELENGLFWALGFEAGDTPQVLSAAADGTFALELPAGGTAAEVTVETSTELSGPESWSELSSSLLSGASNPIPAGTTGTLTIGTDGEARFYRLVAESPVE